MKRIMCILICLVLFSFVFSFAGAETYTLPSINSVLSSGTTERVEVSDNLDEYSILNEKWSDWSDIPIKLIVLERHSPEKEFTPRTVYPPFSDNDHYYPADFAETDGVNIGKSHLWFRGDLMAKLPPFFRADSLEEATYLIFAEDFYFLMGSLIYTNYSSVDDNIPDFETAEEMTAYFQAHQPVVTSKTYYPTFNSYAIVSIYETQAKKVSLFFVNETPHKEFAGNPEANNYWSNMIKIISLMDTIISTPETTDLDIISIIDSLTFVPPEEADLWKSCISAKKNSYAYQLAEDFLWKMADKLKELDPSSKNRENYDLIINEKNIDALIQYANYCNYSGFDESMETIEKTKEYLAIPDWDLCETALLDTVDIFITE